MEVKYYQAVWIYKNEAFRVNGAVSKDRDEAISMCKRHASVKEGAKLDRVDEWYVWE